MIYTLVIQSAPYSTQGPSSALRFAQAALQAGHTIGRVFFYGDGVTVANGLNTPPQDEPKAHEAWQALAKEHDIDLVVCIAAAVKRGVIDANEASRYGHVSDSLAEGFTLSGLGQLVDATASADRVITFGH